jgi:septum formation protein
MTHEPNPPRLILGSGSPRRLELLAVRASRQTPFARPTSTRTPEGGTAAPLLQRIAAEKVAAVKAGEDDVVLCADTTVALGRRILGKPATRRRRRRFCARSRGAGIGFIPGVAVKRGGKVWARVIESRVKMKRCRKSELDGYLATGDWQGKAGGYSIQGPAGAFIPWISGSHSAIVGLPLAETATLLTAAAIRGTRSRENHEGTDRSVWTRCRAARPPP